MPQPRTGLSGPTGEVVGIPKRNQRLCPPSGLARDERGVGRISPGIQSPGPRTHLARDPREVGSVVAPREVAQAAAASPRAPGSAARQSNRDWPLSNLLARALGSPRGSCRQRRCVALHRLEDPDGTTSGRSDKDDCESTRPWLTAYCIARNEGLQPSGADRPARTARSAHAAGGPFLESKPGSVLQSVKEGSTWSRRLSAVWHIRRPMHEGQNPRPRQRNATRRCSEQPSHLR
jgi:hypothetical protein